tara:strand:+ start:2964 stop:5126 length:2163 start_codon:yes stop_codon:yes gene_type:complete
LDKKNIKISFFVLTSIFAFSEGYLNAKCFSVECNNLEKNSIYNKNQDEKFPNANSLRSLNISFKDNLNINKTLGEEIHELDKFINSILVSNFETENVSSDSFSYQIDSDSQYIENDIFYAEGNVNIILPNGILNAEKISYDKSNKIFKAYSNLDVSKGNQFFKADYLEYNFLKNKGYIENIYGTLDFKTINNDLKIYNSVIKNQACQYDEINLNDLPTEIELLGSNNERYKNSIGLNKIKFNFSEITNWRFKSKRVELEENKWNADLIEFTNDPYNKPQLVIISKNFRGEINKNETKFISKSTSLNFEDKLTIPVIGKRTITNKNDENLRWGVGYDPGDKDGLYIMRNFDGLNLSKYFSIKLQPYFLLQRAIEGKSEAFRNRDSDVLSDNVKRNINFYDYFGLNTKFKGDFYKWNLNINVDSKTLNTENFYDAFSGDLNLVRNLYSVSSIKNISQENDCDNKSFSKNNSEKISIDWGFYSVLDRDEIYTSYGSKLLTNYKFKKQNLNKDYSLVFDIGQYQGKSLQDSTNLEKLTRYGFNSSLSHKYKIAEFNNKIGNYSDQYNTPKLIDNGLFLNVKLGSGLYEYSDGKSQGIFSFMMGPSYTYGSLKNNFLDYTRISIYPELLIKNGASPFVFDDFNSDSRIRFDIRQQLFGPFILGLQGNYNINTKSTSYGVLENKVISLELSRRAYSLGLSYKEDDKSIFFGFEIFNIGDSTFIKEF